MKNNIDLNKIKSEIDLYKQTKGTTTQSEINLPKDNFLFELETSLRSGSESRATNRIKLVENKVAEKANETPVHRLDNTKPIAPPATRPIQKSGIVNENDDRGELMFRDLNSKVNNRGGGGLVDAISEYSGQKQPQRNGGQMLNEEAINEIVSAKVNDYLSKNLGGIFEEAIKETILDIYAKERIKAVLSEDTDLIKTHVYSIIREIQKKNK